MPFNNCIVIFVALLIWSRTDYSAFWSAFCLLEKKDFKKRNKELSEKAQSYGVTKPIF